MRKFWKRTGATGIVLLMSAMMIPQISSTAFAADESDVIVDVVNVQIDDSIVRDSKKYGGKPILDPELPPTGMCGENSNWTLNSDGLLRVYGEGAVNGKIFAGAKNVKSVVIEEGITSIGDNAFYDCTAIESIVLPSSLKKIDSFAFWGCTGLHNIEIPAGVNEVRWSVFGGCDNMETVSVDASNKAYDSRDNCNAIIEKATNTLVAGCNNTRIPSSVSKIGEAAFQGCNLETIVIPDGVTSIGQGAFTGCENLKSIKIPAGITSIESSTFGRCYNLSYIELPPNLKKIKYGAFQQCTSLETIDLPSELTSIENLAFAMCSNLRSIEIPAKITSIGYGVFLECGNLLSICIPTAVSDISGSAFFKCDNLKEVYFKGTKSQWDSISIEPYGNESLTSATKYYKTATDISDCSISPLKDQTYTGRAIKPVLTVKDGMKKLAEGTDYKVSYSNNTNAGTAKATISGIGEYEGHIVISFQIKPLSLSSKAALSYSSKAYTGSALEPAVKMTVGGKTKTLKEGVDYSVTFKNNKNVGKATAVIQGKGNFTGSQNISFQITKADNPLKIKSPSKGVKVCKSTALKKNKAAFSIKIVNAEGKMTYSANSVARNAGIKVSARGTVTVPKNCKNGKYQIIVKAAGNKNYKPGEKRVTIKIQ